MRNLSTPAKAGVGTVGVASLAMVLQIAAAFIPPHEGTVLKGYRDPIGIVTACTGHTKTAKLGRVYTREECTALFQQDLVEHARAMAPCIRQPIPIEAHAAFLSFAFNVGSTKFCNSTLARKANAGDIRGACAELSKWVWAGGKKFPGLVRRRAEERALCERGLR